MMLNRCCKIHSFKINKIDITIVKRAALYVRHCMQPDVCCDYLDELIILLIHEKVLLHLLRHMAAVCLSKLHNYSTALQLFTHDLEVTKGISG